MCLYFHVQIFAHILSSDAQYKRTLYKEKKETLIGLNLFIFVIGLFCLHGLLCLIRLLHLNQGGTGHAKDAMNIHPHLDLHLGAFTRRLGDNFLDKELTCMERKKTMMKKADVFDPKLRFKNS